MSSDQNSLSLTQAELWLWIQQLDKMATLWFRWRNLLMTLIYLPLSPQKSWNGRWTLESTSSSASLSRTANSMKPGQRFSARSSRRFFWKNMMATGTLKAQAEARHSGTVLRTRRHPQRLHPLVDSNTNKCFLFHRCIRMNKEAVCTLVQRACEESELTPAELRLPDVTLWIDPLEVCARWVTGCAACEGRGNDWWAIKWRHLLAESQHKCCIICCSLQVSAMWRSQRVRVVHMEQSSAPLCRSGENSRPFVIASFDEEGKSAAKEEQDDCASQETSDYHSATSSDCGSAASSDAEEDVKDEEKEDEDDGKEATKNKAEVNNYTITMVPRIRKRLGNKASAAKCGRHMVNSCQQVKLSRLSNCIYPDLCWIYNLTLTHQV